MKAFLSAVALVFATVMPAQAQYATTCTRDFNSSVNLRNGPGRNYGVIASIPSNRYLRALTWVWGNDGMRWYRVEYEGLIGHVRGDYLCRD
jgi:uncharacterized protein YraI